MASTVCDNNTILSELLPYFRPPSNPTNLINPAAFQALVGAIKLSQTATLKCILYEAINGIFRANPANYFYVTDTTLVMELVHHFEQSKTSKSPQILATFLDILTTVALELPGANIQSPTNRYILGSQELSPILPLLVTEKPAPIAVFLTQLCEMRPIYFEVLTHRKMGSVEIYFCFLSA